MRFLRAAIILAALGATLGVALDGIHSHFGATSYPHPVFFRAAWWVPLLFGGAFTIGLVRPLLQRGGAAPSWGAVLGAFVFFVAAYFTSVFPAPWPLLAGAIFVLFLASWWLCDRAPIQLAIAAGAALGGPAVECVLVARGAFVHHSVAALGVPGDRRKSGFPGWERAQTGLSPGWLPFLYMTASVALCLLARRLVAA